MTATVKTISVYHGAEYVAYKSGCLVKSLYITKERKTQALVKKLQAYITENFYTCTNEILAGLGQMYIADELFKKTSTKTVTAQQNLSLPQLNFFANKHKIY